MAQSETCPHCGQPMPSGPSEVSEFRLHQRVNHVSLGEGEVTENDGCRVTVTFDRAPKGRAVIGIYDNNWFRICPNTLFHRPAIRQREPSK